jgi:hypothetical protein
MFIWRLAHNNFPVKRNLARRVRTDTICPVCKSLIFQMKMGQGVLAYFWRLKIYERSLCNVVQEEALWSESGSMRRKGEVLFLSGCGAGDQLGIRPM